MTRCLSPNTKRRFNKCSDQLQLTPKDAWHSWDGTPWAHPWLRAENLTKSRIYEKELLGSLAEKVNECDTRDFDFGFVGNLANNMAMRAGPLREMGLRIDVHGHPKDDYIMSHPGWLLSSAEIEGSRLSIKDNVLPEVPWYYQDPIDSEVGQLLSLAKSVSPNEWQTGHPDAAFLRQRDVLYWPECMPFLPTLRRLQTYSALFAAQCPYLAYIAGKPYLAAQTGGDFWFDASRDDNFGLLQRKSYSDAGAILATNPWAYAHARRFNMAHVLYAPLLIDTEQYSPGQADELRNQWKKSIGGEFYVLMTARSDRMWKGSDIALDGYTDFARRFDGARLLLIGWGNDAVAMRENLLRKGLDGRFLFLPVAGKKRLVDYLRASDCVIDQFKIGYYGATALEAMACGKPVVMKVLDKQYDALCPTGSPPVENADQPIQVSDCLFRLSTDINYYFAKCQKVRRWILDNHSAVVWGNAYSVLLKACAMGLLPNFGDSPLSEPLAQEELEYHREQLCSAPAFPKYAI